MFNHDARWATQRLGAPSSSPVPDRLTQPGLLHSDPISAMRPAVYSPDTLVGSPTANDNSPFHLTRTLVNQPAYINRPIKTLSTTLGPHPSERTAWKQGLPLLPGLQKRPEQVPGPGQGLYTPFSHGSDVLMCR